MRHSAMYVRRSSNFFRPLIEFARRTATSSRQMFAGLGHRDGRKEIEMALFKRRLVSDTPCPNHI